MRAQRPLPRENDHDSPPARLSTPGAAPRTLRRPVAPGALELGSITGVMNTSSAGQGHETLVATVLVEVLERDAETTRVVHTDSPNALPSNSPVGSRMAIVLAGAAAGAARKIKVARLAIAAHTPNTGIAELEYDVGSVSVKANANQKLGWDQLQGQWITQKPLVRRIPDSDCAGVAGSQLRQAA